jgi:predicted extracellular nuclease
MLTVNTREAIMASTRRTLVLALALIAGLVPAIGAAPALGATDVVISEIHYDNVGTDTGEGIEVTGPEGTDLSGWTLVLYNGSSSVRAPYNTLALSGTLLDQDAGMGTSFVSLPTNGLQNGSPDGIALVNTSGTVEEFLSYEGTFLAASGVAAGMTSSDIGVSESGSTAVGQSLQLLDGDWTGPVPSSFGSVNTEPPPPPGPTEVKIHEVQGSGFVSPIVGDRVIVEGVVVGDEETFESLAGFFVQEEDYDVDADPDTSEGVFVFNFSNDDVDLGDVVHVEGTVEERFGNTQLTDFVVVEVLDVASRVATPTTIEFPVESYDILETVEGMAVTFPQTLAVSEYFNYDRFGRVVVGLPSPGADRQITPTARFEPGSAEGLELAELNEMSRITIDDGSDDQNPDFNRHPIYRDEFTTENRFRGGDAVADLTGTIYYTRDEHMLIPLRDDDLAFSSYVQNERPANVPDVGGRLQIATLNALNYFLTLDDGPDICGPSQDQGCRGADDQEEFGRQREKLLTALSELDADIVGLVEIENTPGVSPLADIVEGLNEQLGSRTYDYIHTGVTGTDAIKVGFIYKPASVTTTGLVGVLDTPEFLDPNNTGQDRNRAAVAVSFLEKGTGEKFSLALNHLKSKGSPCGVGDDSPYAGSCDVTRTLAAQELLNWIGTRPTNSKDTDWFIIGDLNSYDKENPIDALTTGGYTDLIALKDGEFAYSYVFDGEWGYLDYIMSTDSATSQVTDVGVWHMNSDEPDIFDYNTSFRPPSQIALFEGDKPHRASDHDAVIAGLSLNQKPGEGNK